MPLAKCSHTWLIGKAITLRWRVWRSAANLALLQQESKWVMVAVAYPCDSNGLNITNSTVRSGMLWIAIVTFLPFYHVTNRQLDCGDISDVVNKNGVFGSEVECTTACPGDPIHTCGNGNRLNAYYWSGTVNNWRTPANIGRFEVCPSVVMSYFS